MKFTPMIGMTAVAAVAAVAMSIPAIPARAQPAVGDAQLAAAPMPALPFDWTGFYVGATAGYDWGHSKHCDTPAFCTSGFGVDGFSAGGTAGYNWDMTNWGVGLESWVVGLETDMSYANDKGTTPSITGVFGCGSTNTCYTKLSWFDTVRGRVGPTFNNWFPYFTGGLVFGRLSAGIGTATSGGSTVLDWTVGGGVEYGVTRNWSVKLEYLYFPLGNLFYDRTHACGNMSCTAVQNNYSVARVGANYRF